MGFLEQWVVGHGSRSRQMPSTVYHVRYLIGVRNTSAALLHLWTHHRDMSLTLACAVF
jgi:hypothetical protein